MKIVKGFALIVLVSWFFASCKKPNNGATTGTLTVQFNPTVGTEPFSFDSIYHYNYNGQDQFFYFNELEMYLSNFSLIKADNSLVQLDTVIYFAYPQGNWMSFSVAAPAGTYKGIQFYFGLDPSQNNTDPRAVAITNPLSNVVETDMYWSWLKYRFINLSGRADTSAADNFVHGVGLDYHVGTDTCYRQISLTGNGVSVAGGGNTNINLNLDVEKIFYNTSGILNMIVAPGTQSVDTMPGNDIDVAIQFANQITHAFSYSNK